LSCHPRNSLPKRKSLKLRNLRAAVLVGEEAVGLNDAHSKLA